MLSNPQRFQQHLTNRGGSSESHSLVLDPATGKLMVIPQNEAQNSADRTIILDMNKGGSRDFFSLDEHQQHLENRGGGSESHSLVLDPATGKLMVKPQQADGTIMLDMNKGGSRDFFSLDEHQQYLENRGGGSESHPLVLDPATGKLMGKPQHKAQNSADRNIIRDMNKVGSRDFFSLDEQDLAHGGSRLVR